MWLQRHCCQTLRGRGACTVSPLVLTTAPHEPPLPCQLTPPNIPPSHGEDQKQIHSRNAGLEYQHVFVKELKKHIDVLCCRELCVCMCEPVCVRM